MLLFSQNPKWNESPTPLLEDRAIRTALLAAKLVASKKLSAKISKIETDMAKLVFELATLTPLPPELGEHPIELAPEQKRRVRQVNKKLEELKKELGILDNSRRRNWKITPPILKRIKMDANLFRKAGENVDLNQGGRETKRILDRRMEVLQNERLRITDEEMLKKFHETHIRSALQEAAGAFKGIDPKVAQLFKCFLATDAEVWVTQGVHQADNPHFDVQIIPTVTEQKAPDYVVDKKQIHVNVMTSDEPARLRIESIEYMIGGRRIDGINKVSRDGRIEKIFP